jgi:hypothetical protein
MMKKTLIPLIVIAAAAIMAGLILLPKRLRFSLKIRTKGVFASLELFGIPLWIDMSAVYRYPEGIVLTVMGKRIPFKLKKRRPKTLLPLNALRLKAVNVWGKAGISKRPEFAVTAAGAANVLIMQALCILKTENPSVMIEPCFSDTAIAVNADGIATVYPVKLIIGYIKKKRRKNNESPNRKHNAVVDGGDKAARGRKHRDRFADNHGGSYDDTSRVEGRAGAPGRRRRIRRSDADQKKLA